MLINSIDDLLRYDVFVIPLLVRFCLEPITGLAFLFPCLDPALSRHAAMLETVRLVARLNDVAVMGESVEQRSGHLGIAEHVRPFGEAQVGGEDDAGVLVEF